MNTKTNKELFENAGVVALKADKGVIPDAVEVKLKELGNPHQAIPYYAIYGPGVADPITLEGPITQNQVAAAIEEAQGRKIATAGNSDSQPQTAREQDQPSLPQIPEKSRGQIAVSR